MEFTAMLMIEFDVAVDRISRAMFDEKFAAYGWLKPGGMTSAWAIEFERSSRESALGSTRNMLQLALQGARIRRDHVKAVLHLGPDAPIMV
ncbi:MAG: hypothetical protein IT464_13010 [Planctomycetes bacterium]|nr:hypothetical protein [Planctomycetota bacterium]